MSSQDQLQQPRRLQQDGPAISSMSLGRAWVHNLTHKLDMAQKYGYKGLELFYEDLEYFSREIEQERREKYTAETDSCDSHSFGVDARGGTSRSSISSIASTSSSASSSLSSSPTSELGQDRTSLMLHAAEVLRTMCDARDIKIISMQPFYHYEGLLDRDLHASRIAALKREWLPIAKVLGTDLILIPSNFLPNDQLVDDDGNGQQTIISDLREVAELGQQYTPAVRFCYESLAWGARSRRWQDAWSVAQQVDMANFGICLDAFNVAGLVFADPGTASGRTPDGHDAMAATVDDMVTTLRDHVHKIFIVQVADAEKLDRPLLPGHEFYDPDQPARMSWSRNCRVFYGERDGYLPVASVMRAIVRDLRYTGWISAELFNRRTTDSDPAVPEEMASRGRTSWLQFERDFLLETGNDGDGNGAATVTTTLKRDGNTNNKRIATATTTRKNNNNDSEFRDLSSWMAEKLEPKVVVENIADDLDVGGRE